MTANALGVAIGIGIVWLVWELLGYVPMLESRFFPVVRIDPVRSTDTYRDKTKACFILHLTKLADAVPVDYFFYGSTTQGGYVFSPELGLSTYLANDKFERDTRRFGTHAQGVKWDRHWCFELPETVADWQTIFVTGRAEHRRHWFYNSITTIPPFEIPPLKG